MVRWCPSVPCCGRAVRVEGDAQCEPECACGLRFCFACADEPHSPCTCDMCVGIPPSLHLEVLSSPQLCSLARLRLTAPCEVP